MELSKEAKLELASIQSDLYAALGTKIKLLQKKIIEIVEREVDNTIAESEPRIIIEIKKFIAKGIGAFYDYKIVESHAMTAKTIEELYADGWSYAYACGLLIKNVEEQVTVFHKLKVNKENLND